MILYSIICSNRSQFMQKHTFQASAWQSQPICFHTAFAVYISCSLPQGSTPAYWRWGSRELIHRFRHCFVVREMPVRSFNACAIVDQCPTPYVFTNWIRNPSSSLLHGRLDFGTVSSSIGRSLMYSIWNSGRYRKQRESETVKGETW